MIDVLIKQATDEKELKKIYQLRYKVYREILNDDIPHMDHNTKELQDPIDSQSYILGAYIEDQLVGSIRGIIYKELHLPPEEINFQKIYNIFSYKDASVENSVEAGKLCLLKEYHHQGVVLKLIKELLKIGTTKNPQLKYVFMETTNVLLKYLLVYYKRKKLPFKELSGPKYNPEFNAMMHPLVLEVDRKLMKNIMG